MPSSRPDASRPSIAEVQRQAREFLGEAHFAEIHRQRLLPDLFVTVAPPMAIAAALWFVGREGVGWTARIGVSLLIGWLMMVMGLVAHDLFLHRRRWGPRASRWLGGLAFALVTNRFTAYGLAHIRHHARLNTPDDTEQYKQDLDSPARRWAFCTAPGFKLATSGRWARPRRDGYFPVDAADPRTRARLRGEQWAAGALVLLAVVALWLDPVRAVFGYWVPLLLVAPALNCVRIVVEHADCDDRNPFWTATDYRCGWLTRVLFVNAAGDCHLVHHLFPLVPFYQCPRARELLGPLLAAHGVIERRSLPRLLHGWFVAGYRHRTVWPLDHTAAGHAVAPGAPRT